MTIPVGHHVTLDLFDCACEEEILARLAKGQEVMDQCVKGFNVLKVQAHQFEPQSYTITYLLAESHCAIHTWTQHRLVSLDFYTCTGMIPEASVHTAIALFKPKRMTRVDIRRGSRDPVIRTEVDFDAGV